MTAEENKTTIRRLFNVINSNELSALDELVDENFEYKATSGEEYTGLDGFKDLVSAYHEAFDDFEVNIEEMIIDGDKCLMLYSQRGRHTGELLGIPASNNEMELWIASKGTFKNGKLVEVFDIFDTLELLGQLDALPEEVQEWSSGAGRRN